MSPFCDCSNGLEQAQLLRTVGKLARAGEQAGFSIEEMIEMLNSGMSVADLLNLITRRLPSGHATRKEDRQGGHGPEARGSSVLDVAQGVGLRASEKVRFAGSKTLLSYSVDQGFDSIA